MKFFSAGFLGTVTNECLVYACGQLERARTVVVPFTGSGKDVAALSEKENRTIYSWDTQEVSRLLVGVLQTPWNSLIEEPKGRVGWARDEHPFSGLDEGTARLMNYIALDGSVQDKAALAKTVIGCTLMGRLGAWSSSNEGWLHFWHKFCRTRENLQDWADQPGTIIHMKGDFFDGTPPERCDALYLDPPKIIGRTDIYSGKAFRNLNGILEQRNVKQPEWKVEGYLERIEQVLKSTQWKKALVFYASGLVPTLKALLEGPAFKGYKSVADFDHGSRVDHVIVLER